MKFGAVSEPTEMAAEAHCTRAEGAVYSVIESYPISKARDRVE